MSTYMPKAGQVDRKWYVLDAAGKPLGRHLRAVRYDTLMAEKPEKAMELAVKRMVPDTTIGRAAMTRLRIYAGAEHNHAAQKPEAWEL